MQMVNFALGLRSVHSSVLLKVLGGFRVYMWGDIWGVVERGCKKIERDCGFECPWNVLPSLTSARWAMWLMPN